MDLENSVNAQEQVKRTTPFHIHTYFHVCFQDMNLVNTYVRYSCVAYCWARIQITIGLGFSSCVSACGVDATTSSHSAASGSSPSALVAQSLRSSNGGAVNMPKSIMKKITATSSTSNANKPVIDYQRAWWSSDASFPSDNGPENNKKTKYNDRHCLGDDHMADICPESARFS